MPCICYGATAGGLAVTETSFRTKGAPTELKGTYQEIQALSKHFPGTFWTGASATKKQFIQDAPSFQLIHLAMHAEANYHEPLYAKLHFASHDQPDSSFLYAYELPHLPIKAEMVVLSGCQTG